MGVQVPIDGGEREVPTSEGLRAWLNHIEAQITALRYFAHDGADHPAHEAQGCMIRPYIACRNRNAHDRALREVVNSANRCLTRD